MKSKVLWNSVSIITQKWHKSWVAYKKKFTFVTVFHLALYFSNPSVISKTIVHRFICIFEKTKFGWFHLATAVLIFPIGDSVQLKALIQLLHFCSRSTTNALFCVIKYSNKSSFKIVHFGEQIIYNQWLLLS